MIWDSVIAALSQMILDYKSRKFLLVVGFGALLVAGGYYEWAVAKEALYVLAGLVALYLIVEGVADIVSRRSSK